MANTKQQELHIKVKDRELQGWLKQGGAGAIEEERARLKSDKRYANLRLHCLYYIVEL